jgi:hypothetical protein
MKHSRFWIPLICAIFFPAVALAFGAATHKAMNRSGATHQAPGGFFLDDFVRNELGVVEGVTKEFADISLLAWIVLGGEREDDYDLFRGEGLLPSSARFFNHFHDPLRGWDDAGLQLFPLAPRFDSSIVWMQRDDSGDAGIGAQGWSWPDARRSYYHALTLEGLQDRNQKWADTFRALGQIMHLVEDAAQPQHTRNDPHPIGFFEGWVDQHLDQGSFSLDPAFVRAGEANTRFDRRILYQPTRHAEAPVPVARLIDTVTYQCNPPSPQPGSACDPNGTLIPAIGIAEFTNANFFTEGTVPGPYPYPDVTRVQPSENTATTTALVAVNK